MSDELTRLFDTFDRGTLSRRQLLQALGIAAVAAPFRAFGQGRCTGDLVGTPACDTTPLPPPFAPTGWKTVLLDHFHLQVAEPEKEAAFYEALMGWKVRSVADGKIMMDIGDWGGVLIRGGLAVPPPPPPRAAGDTAGGGRGGRGGGGGGGGARRANWDGYCWGIDQWNTATVEAELKKRGLNPVADHNPAINFYSFHVKDPDGMDVQVSNGTRQNRRNTPATARLAVPAPFDATGWKTMYLDHISFSVTSYKETVAFYQALLGWTSRRDEGSQASVTVSPDFGGLIIRGGNANAPGGAAASLWNRGRGGGRASADTGGRGAPPPPLVRSARMDHISFGIADFDYEKVRAELQKRGLRASVDTGGSQDIAVSRYKSYHTTTPNGFDLQISNTVSAG